MLTYAADHGLILVERQKKDGKWEKIPIGTAYYAAETEEEVFRLLHLDYICVLILDTYYRIYASSCYCLYVSSGSGCCESRLVALAICASMSEH